MKWSVKRSGDAAEPIPFQETAVLSSLSLDPEQSDAHKR